MQDQRSLSDAFLEDHQHLTKGLSETLAALERDDLARAVEKADELDRQAGAHIRFEEEFFYPEVAKRRGSDYVSQLLHEHDAGRQAIRELLARGAQGHLAPDAKARILAGLHEALDHAVSCGTLLSHVTTLEPSAQRHYLQQLLRLRSAGGRWTAPPNLDQQAPAEANP